MECLARRKPGYAEVNTKLRHGVDSYKEDDHFRVASRQLRLQCSRFTGIAPPKTIKHHFPKQSKSGKENHILPLPNDAILPRTTSTLQPLLFNPSLNRYYFSVVGRFYYGACL